MNPFHCVKFKKHFQSQSRVLGILHFWVRNDPFALNNFFWYKPLLLPSSTYWHFSVCKIFKKHSCSRSRVMRTHTFWIQNGSFAPIFFLEKIMNIIFIYPLAPFVVINLKKILKADPGLWRCTIFWVINGSFATIRIFFRKPVNNPCSFHSCLSTCQISKSDDDLLKKYWWLKNTEISLAKRHFRL